MYNQNERNKIVKEGVVLFPKLKQGQMLWFIDNETKKKNFVTVKEVYENSFSFVYNSKTYNCPYSHLGKKIYVIYKKQIPTVFYRGELYEFDNEKWVKYDGSVYSKNFQNKLSKLHKSRENTFSANYLIQRGICSKQQKNYRNALSYFEMAVCKADEDEIISIISTLSSLYRMFNYPNASIELYKYVSYKHKIKKFPVAFLTSLAAAYLDIGKRTEALDFASKAYAMSNGHASDELNSLYRRLNKSFD